jgi:putative ABC transport system substrate-binding protein
MATRRQFLLASALCAMAPEALAQTRQVKVGILLARHPSFYGPGIVERLRELGYREGQGMTLLQRSADGVAEKFPALARELVDAKCDVIFAVGPEHPVRALQNAAAPAVVFLAVDYDPVERGIVTNFRKPDRNTTGVFIPQPALAVKRLQLLREIVPSARRVLVFSDTFCKDQLQAVRSAGEAAGLQMTVIDFSKPPYDFTAAFEKAREAQVEGMVGLTSPVFATRAKEIGALLVKHRLPGVGWSVESLLMGAGFLIGYGDSPGKVSRRAGEIGARILKGAKPADIPVEQADEFELFIDAKIAQALGVRIPESVRARATHIMQ